MANEKKENVKKILIYVNHGKTKDGKSFTSYRTHNDELGKYVSVVFCKEVKEIKPLQKCYAVVYDNSNYYNFGQDFNGYDVMFLSKVIAFEPFNKEDVAESE